MVIESTVRAFRFAWLSVVRQPARALLGIAGVAAIGALLFDMLLLSRGLVLSFADLLDRSGFDVRVMASDAPPFTGPRLTNADALADQIRALRGVDAVLTLRVRDADLAVDPTGHQDQPPRQSDATDDDSRGRVHFIGADPRVRSMWTILQGEDLSDAGPRAMIVINQRLAKTNELQVGSRVTLRGRCDDLAGAAAAVSFTVAGIAEFPFDSATAATVAGTLEDVDRLCGETRNQSAEMFLVRSAPGLGAAGAAAEIRTAHPELYIVTNEELVERFVRVEFSYFRQISAVLAIVTLFFGFLLITVLLTVSVNQRLAEIAALRALGFSRSRVIAGVFWESLLLVGIGGALAVPLGAALSVWLDTILRSLPNLPARLHFFVFEPRALVLYVLLLVVASIAAAIYPIRIVSVLPIAGTLRREVVS
jgi:putative ABC transport system permease protein